MKTIPGTVIKLVRWYCPCGETNFTGKGNKEIQCSKCGENFLLGAIYGNPNESKSCSCRSDFDLSHEMGSITDLDRHEMGG